MTEIQTHFQFLTKFIERNYSDQPYQLSFVQLSYFNLKLKE